MSNELEEEIRFEISQINKLFDEGKPLFDLFRNKKEFDFIEKSAAGSFLHSFYNGIENSLKLIYKGLNEKIDNSLDWHKKLFDKSFNPTEKYPALFNKEYKIQLEDYLKFRHFFRYSYGFNIESKKLTPLFKGAKEIWEKVQNDLENFISIYNLKNNRNTGFSGIPSLEFIVFYRCEIISLNGIENSDQIKRLEIDFENDYLGDFTVFSKLKELEELSVFHWF